MRIRRYVARSLAQALEQVRRELGPDALILQTRQRRRWLPWWPPRVEVWAAWEPQTPGPRVASRGAAGQARGPAGNSEAAMPSVSLGNGGPWLERLLEHDVEASLAWKLVGAACARSRAAAIPVEQALADQLAHTVPTADVWQPDVPTRVVMLVGPTGAGKTTTVAKLAANFALVAGWQVALVTADTYRIGAIQQLRTYAELIGVPLEVARDGEELRQLVRVTTGQLLLVDTAGHSPHDRERMARLRELCRSLPDGAEVMLVLPATLRQADLAEMVATYRQLPIGSVCITKLDETRRRGPLVNAPCWLGRPLRFVTTGQSVPDDIEAVEGASLARWLLGEGPALPEAPGPAGRAAQPLVGREGP